MISPLARLEGKYEILEKIQEGGMGAIYKVRHLLLDEPRVIKVMRPHLQQDPNLRERFLAEGRAAARLNHPNIARIFDFTIDDQGVAYLVMEFIPGWTLGDLLRRGEPLPVQLALEIAQQSLAAIGHMHLHKMVHRDIAPDNLILGTSMDGQPLIKLIDLGIAKATEGGSQLTDAGVFVGKFRYAAPELFEETSARNEPRSDLYSLALVLYELMTLQFPISGTTSSSLIAGHLFRPPLSFDISDSEGRLSESIRQALLRGLAKAPDERFADAKSFTAALPAADLSSEAEAVRTVLDLTAEARPKDTVSLYNPGSTQARFDAQFAPLPTPAPLPPMTPSPDRPTEIMPSIAEQLGPSHPLNQLAGTDPNASTVILLPDSETPTITSPTPLVSPPTQVEASEPNQRTAALLEEAKLQAAREDFTAARQTLDHILQIDPALPAAQQLRGSLDALQEVQLEETRQTEIISRRALPQRTAAPQGTVSFPVAPAAPTTPATPLSPDAPAAPVTVGPSISRPPSPIPESITEAVPTNLEEEIQKIRQMQSDGRIGAALQAMHRCVQEHGTEPRLKELRNELGLALLAQDAEQQEEIDPFGTVPSLRSSGLIPTTTSVVPTDGPQQVIPPPPPAAAEPTVTPPATTPPATTPPATTASAAPAMSTSQLDDLLAFNHGSSTVADPAESSQPTTGGSAPVAEMTLDGRRALADVQPQDTFDSSPTPIPTESTARSATLPARQNQRSMLIGGILLVVLFALLGLVLSRYRPNTVQETLQTEDVIPTQLSPGFLKLDIRPWGEIESIEDQHQEKPALHPSRMTPVLLSLPPGTYRLRVRYPPNDISRELTLEVKSGEILEHLEVFHQIDSEAYFRVQSP